MAEAKAYVEALDTPSAPEPPLNSHRLAATATFPALIVLAGIAYFSYQYACSTSTPGGFRNVGAQPLQQIHNDVAADLVEQYFIAKRAGKPMDACVHAGIVAAAYLQAKDESLYRLWKQTEKQDCVNAGLSR